MALASHLPGSRNAAAWFARICGSSRAFAPAAILAILLAPAIVRGDIYKWTDERGITVISNVQPVSRATASGMELLAAEARPAAPAPGARSQAAPTGTEQALEARIENLERQLQAQQLAQQAQGVPPPIYSADYYPAPPPPPPDPNYYGGYDPNYYSSYGPFYSSGYYPYALPLAYSYIAVPARPLHRPGFVSRPHGVNRPPVFAGRPPVFTNRSPALTNRSPAFTNRSPAFASHPVSGSSRPASSGGGTMHGGRR